MADKFHDECGVFGIWGHPKAVECTLRGLSALQHRGQDSCGIATSKLGQIQRLCCSGLTGNLAADPALALLTGSIAIGHVRYSTVGECSLANAQPIVLRCPQADVALCHNGQLVNIEELKNEVMAGGADLLTNSDSELILQLCSMSSAPAAVDSIVESLPRLQGAYSLLLLANDELIAARDPHGFRPLCMAKLGDAIVVCSETCALDAIGAQYLREIEPGEVTVIGQSGIRNMGFPRHTQKAHCIFEHVYFSRPDSHVFEQSVGGVRTRLGRNLAMEAPVDADVIVPIPESGMWVALGYQQATGIPMHPGLVRNSYVGRTFIDPDSEKRPDKVQLKLNPVASVVKGKRVLLIDDSIVRGTTIAGIVESMRLVGAKEVHVRIGSPPTVASCFYGINTPDRTELIAAEHSVEEIRQAINADSLAYLSLTGLLDAVETKKNDYCTACYTGQYIVKPLSVTYIELKQPETVTATDL
ncbi:MAG: amidophosphoribosyltransferase [Candidatus Sulfotelmatobacter sp.]